MKSALCCCLMLGAFPALGQITPVTVYTGFQHHPSQGVLSALQAEADFILARLGVPLQWRTLDHRQGNEVSVELAVATFTGTCDVAFFGSGIFRSGGLGFTHVSDGSILPFTEIDCGRVSAFLRSHLVGLPPAERSAIFGRALGRVLAHELYHILGRSAHHSRHGVDQPAFTAGELVSDEFQLDDSHYRILRTNASAVTAPPAAMRQAIGSPKVGKTVFQQQGCSACHGPRAEGTRNGPALRIVGRFLNPIVLAAKLGIDAGAMCRKAGRLKLAAPSMDEDDLGDVLSFLNTGDNNY